MNKTQRNRAHFLTEIHNMKKKAKRMGLVTATHYLGLALKYALMEFCDMENKVPIFRRVGGEWK